MQTANVRRLPGASLGFEDLTAVAALIRERLAAGVDGVVVVQGMDTIGETAYLLDLYHPATARRRDRRHAQPPQWRPADGLANLLAASPTARGAGCVVVLADEIHATRRVRKTHSTAASTSSRSTAARSATWSEGQPRILNPVSRRIVVPAPVDGRQPTVVLLVVSLGDHGLLLDGLADRVDGAVIAGFGVGHVPQQLTLALGHLAARVPTVLASRTGAGSVLASTYGFPGS